VREMKETLLHHMLTKTAVKDRHNYNPRTILLKNKHNINIYRYKYEYIYILWRLVLILMCAIVVGVLRYVNNNNHSLQQIIIRQSVYETNIITLSIE